MTVYWYSRAQVDSMFTTTNNNVTANTNSINTLNSEWTGLDGSVAGFVGSSSSSTRTALDKRYVIHAPAPSGGDDTAVLQGLLNTAQSTSGTLVLQAGTYLANLATAQSFVQPRVVGQGMNLTKIQAYVNTSAVLRFKGGSGGFCGGLIEDLSLVAASAGGGVALQIADACGMKWTRIRLSGTFAEGIQFVNESSGGFAEYNCGDVTIDQEVVLPVRYKIVSGANSFHGTGLTQGSVINQVSTSTSPMIQIDAGALVYAAPMTVALFPRQVSGTIIANNSTNHAAFFGSLDIEVQTAGPNAIGGGTGATIYYQGTVNALVSANLHLGTLYLVDKVYYDQGNIYFQPRPFQRNVTLASGTTPLMLAGDVIGNGVAALINVNVNAPNYVYVAQLLCWQSPYNSGGYATVVASSFVNNGTGAGAPTFGWTNYGLTITNTSYTSSYIANVGVTPIGGNTNGDALVQG